MIHNNVTLNDGTIVTISQIIVFETYEFNLKPKTSSAEKNKKICGSFEFSVKKMMPQHNIAMLLDDYYIFNDNTSLPDTVFAILLRSSLSEGEVSSVVVICFQDSTNDMKITDDNTRKIKSLNWRIVSKKYMF